jgi:hypothetical protein
MGPEISMVFKPVCKTDTPFSRLHGLLRIETTSRGGYQEKN